MIAVDVLLFDATDAPPPPVELLSASSRARYAALGSPRRRHEFLHGRRLLGMAMGRALQRECAVSEVEEGPAGPRTPALVGLALSLSHARSMLAAVASPLRCGVDVERVDGTRDVLALAAFALPDIEVAWIQAGAAEAPDRFFQLWSLREAAFKAGLRQGVTAGDAVVHQGAISVPFGFDSALVDGYRVTIAAPDRVRMNLVRVRPGEWRQIP